MRIAGFLIALLVVPSSASASEILGLNAENVRLEAGVGQALVRYTAEGGARRVVFSDAVDARAPSPTEPQVAFRRDYGARTLQGRRFPNECEPYDGPPLPNLVVACTVSDGSSWAIQAWQRLLAMRGFDPFRAEQASVEFHVSHWSGPLAALEVSQNWTYDGAWQGVFGRMTYRGAPVFGFRTPSATRRDPYARYVYIDARNSVYGAGWKRDTAVTLHVGNGAFCYSFVPQKPPLGYPSQDVRGPAVGDRHRVTVMGPGVTPDVQWEGSALAAYDAAQDTVFNRLFDRLVGSGDRVCARER